MQTDCNKGDMITRFDRSTIDAIYPVDLLICEKKLSLVRTSIDNELSSCCKCLVMLVLTTTAN